MLGVEGTIRLLNIPTRQRRPRLHLSLMVLLPARLIVEFDLILARSYMSMLQWQPLDGLERVIERAAAIVESVVVDFVLA